jgi:hypothetical protein
MIKPIAFYNWFLQEDGSYAKKLEGYYPMEVEKIHGQEIPMREAIPWKIHLGSVQELYPTPEEAMEAVQYG